MLSTPIAVENRMLPARIYMRLCSTQPLHARMTSMTSVYWPVLFLWITSRPALNSDVDSKVLPLLWLRFNPIRPSHTVMVVLRLPLDGTTICDYTAYPLEAYGDPLLSILPAEENHHILSYFLACVTLFFCSTTRRSYLLTVVLHVDARSSYFANAWIPECNAFRGSRYIIRARRGMGTRSSDRAEIDVHKSNRIIPDVHSFHGSPIAPRRMRSQARRFGCLDEQVAHGRAD